MIKPFQILLLRGFTTALITAHAPGQHIWPSRAQGQTQVLQTVEVQCSCVELESCQRETATDEILEENKKECSNIKVHV